MQGLAGIVRIKENWRCQKDFAALEMVKLMDETVVGWNEWEIRRRCHGWLTRHVKK